MKQVLVLMALALMAATVRSDIVAQESDFKIDCGQTPGQIVSVTYKSSAAANIIAKLSAPNNKKTCAVDSANTEGEWIISDVSTNCDIIQPFPTKPEYLLQVTLQEVAGVYQQKDPTFVVRCNYAAGDVAVTSRLDNLGTIGAPTFVEVTSFGDPDMTYSLQLVDTTNQPLSAAKFGDNIGLQVTMSDTDIDENGVKVKECEVKSGDVAVPIIQDYCVVDSKKSLFTLPGFVSASKMALFPMTVFAVEGSTESSVEFFCNVTICSEACEGQNCESARRKRRASGDEPTTDKSVLMATKLQILPVSVSAPPASQTSEPAMSCMQSLGFIVTVAVLAVLLLVAMIAVIFMFTARRRELQKQGA